PASLLHREHAREARVDVPLILSGASSPKATRRSRRTQRGPSFDSATASRCLAQDERKWGSERPLRGRLAQDERKWGQSSAGRSFSMTSWSKVHWSGRLSVRQRRNLQPWRTRPPQK